MNGYEAIKAIRSLPDEALASVPIFAMTANVFDKDRKVSLAVGMNGHIAKPIDAAKLIDELKKVL